MIFRKAALLPVFLSTQFTAAYFAPVNNAHVDFVATGALDARGGEETVDDRASLQHAGSSLWTALEGALARHAPLGFAAPEIMTAFEEWGGRFEREYATLEEKSQRLLVWLENHVLIETHNAKNLSFTLGHNDFSDLTHAEFRERMRLGEFAPALERREGREFKFMEFNEEKEAADASPRLRGPGQGAATGRKLPAVAEQQDWHEAGFMGPVRNQGKCGACWAFSAAGAIESAMAIGKYNDMSPAEQAKLTGGAPANGVSLKTDLGLVVDLSEQNMIDCDTVNELGCDGGLMIDAFDEEEVKLGICSENDYPYTETQGTCAADMCTPVPGSIVKDQVDVVPRENNALVVALNVQPVTAAMVATDPPLQFYRGGIYQVADCGKVTKQLGDEKCEMVYEEQDVCFPDVNHGVLVVGYGTDAAVAGDLKTYFKVKNSWGGHWGEGGYFRLARYETDIADPMNNWGECAILSLLSYPVME